MLRTVSSSVRRFAVNQTLRRSFVTSQPRYAEEQTQTQKSGASGSLNVRFVTPIETIVNNEVVNAVTIPAVTGVMGILADHAPTIAQLQAGVISVHKTDVTDMSQRHFVSGGFAIITPESSCSITTAEAIHIDDLDVAVARQNLSDAQANLARLSGEKEKAEVQIAIEVYESIIAAIDTKA